MRVNDDGKFVARVVPAMLAAVVAVAGTSLYFWRDSAVADSVQAIEVRQVKSDVAELKNRFAADISDVKRDQAEMRRIADADRQKTSDVASDVKMALAILRRLEEQSVRQPPPWQEPK